MNPGSPKSSTDQVETKAVYPRSCLRVQLPRGAQSLQDAVAPVIEGLAPITTSPYQIQSSGIIQSTSCSRQPDQASIQPSHNTLSNGNHPILVIPQTQPPFREEIQFASGTISDIVLDAFPDQAPTVSENALGPPPISHDRETCQAAPHTAPLPRRRVRFLLPPDHKERENGPLHRVQRKRQTSPRGEQGEPSEPHTNYPVTENDRTPGRVLVLPGFRSIPTSRSR